MLSVLDVYSCNLKKRCSSYKLTWKFLQLIHMLLASLMQTLETDEWHYMDWYDRYWYEGVNKVEHEMCIGLFSYCPFFTFVIHV